MKKIVLLVLSAVISLSLFSGCNGGSLDDDGVNGESQNPTVTVGVDGYTYDSEYHWKKEDKSDKKAHVNDLGRCRCGLYYQSDDIVYDLRVDGSGNNYYAVSAYEKNGRDLDCHIEIPAYYQGSSDSAPIPVLEIDNDVFNSNLHNMRPIFSIKLNEGLKKIGRQAFLQSSIEELIIPNSVVGSLYHIVGGCTSLKTVIVGDGVEVIDGYCFSSCPALKYVKLGSSVREIQRRAFYECNALADLVLPKSLVSIPEYEIYSASVGKYVSINNIFQGVTNYPDIFMEITEEELDALIIPRLERNPITGLTIDPITGEDIPYEEFEFTTYGYVQGWCGFADIYYVGEWHFDENGRPVPNK